MRNYVAVVFHDKSKAYKGLHGLWILDAESEITVHGTAVVHRDAAGHFHIDTKDTHPVFATAVGVGVGALLGLFAGPVGIAVGLAAGAGIGAVAGGVVGGATDMLRSDTRAQAFAETRLILDAGQSAVLADVSEDSSMPVNDRMSALGGTVYRRAKRDVSEDAQWFDGVYPLYPYEYVPAGGLLYG